MRNIVIGAIGVVVAAASWSSFSSPVQASPGTTIAARTTADADHGKYLVEHVAMCIECHSPRDEDGRIIPGSEFTGAALPFKVPAGWATRAPRNRGLLGYDDDQAMRLLTQGAMGREGHQLLPPMPRFRMTHEDATDVIAYLRSLK